MKKKLLSLMLASALALGVVGGLAACNNEPEKPEVPATGIKLDRTTMSITPDDQKGIIATLTPADATTEVVWTSSDEDLVTVKGGLVYAWDSGTVTVTATAGEAKATCTVTVGDWARYALAGTINGWNASNDTHVFKQDATDKHKWTIDVNLATTDEFKFVPAVKGGKKDDGTDWGADVWHGGGWSGDFGCDAKKENATVKGDSGKLNTNGSDNIKVETAGNYTITVQMKVGGGIESVTYKRNGDVKPAA